MVFIKVFVPPLPCAKRETQVNFGVLPIHVAGRSPLEHSELPAPRFWHRSPHQHGAKLKVLGQILKSPRGTQGAKAAEEPAARGEQRAEEVSGRRRNFSPSAFGSDQRVFFYSFLCRELPLGWLRACRWPLRVSWQAAGAAPCPAHPRDAAGSARSSQWAKFSPASRSGIPKFLTKGPPAVLRNP